MKILINLSYIVIVCTIVAVVLPTYTTIEPTEQIANNMVVVSVNDGCTIYVQYKKGTRSYYKVCEHDTTNLTNK
jgi:endonuclease YncB( thermonuclease family)